MSFRNVSNSREQKEAEPVVLDLLERECLGIRLSPRTIWLPGTRRSVRIDGVSETSPPTLVEIYAHQGPLKGGQADKVLSDAMKLSTVRQMVYPDARCCVVFCDHGPYDDFEASWKATALRMHRIDMLVVNIPANLRDTLLAAQARQGQVAHGAQRR